MALPLTVDVPMSRWPWANWVLIGVTLLFSVEGLATRPPPPPLDRKVPEEVRPFYEALRERPPPALALVPDHFAPWQLLTCLLVHSDVPHLVGNLLFLFCFGNAIDAKLGHVPFLGLYFGLGVLAGLFWLAIGVDRPLAGAAGAIMGVVGVFLVFYPKNNVRVLSVTMTGLGTRERPALLFVLLGMGSDLVGTWTSAAGGVDYLCHLAVELVGVAAAIFLLLGGWVYSSTGEQNLLQVLGYQEAGKKKLEPAKGPLKPWAKVTPKPPPPRSGGTPGSSRGM